VKLSPAVVQARKKEAPSDLPLVHPHFKILAHHHIFPIDVVINMNASCSWDVFTDRCIDGFPCHRSKPAPAKSSDQIGSAELLDRGSRPLDADFALAVVLALPRFI